jgi:large subunit ribosomal protein L5
MKKMVEQYGAAVSSGVLGKEANIANVFALPRIEKVVINCGLGRALGSSSQPKNLLEEVRQDIALIVGQQPVVTKAKKSIASFKVRQDQPLGCMVTLRGKRMYDFLDRLVNIALPRSRDFKGISLRSLGRDGNLSMGIKEHTIFPETAQSPRAVGIEITIVTSARDRDSALKLFKSLSFPFQSE